MKAEQAIAELSKYHPEKELMIMWSDSSFFEVEADVWSMACRIFDESSDTYHFKTEVFEMLALARKEIARRDKLEEGIDVYLTQLAEQESK